VVLDLS